ncbi:unnamed protein product [Cuscuta europaea]|uniref:Uncharacterized protein n=1 Tax=Cuscuta europaea TaxID=41803 RepID=A0A9P0YGG8_CUSEU|nr:unnamed protein product [Cuscuta europaea]
MGTEFDRKISVGVVVSLIKMTLSALGVIPAPEIRGTSGASEGTLPHGSKSAGSAEDPNPCRIVWKGGGQPIVGYQKSLPALALFLQLLPAHAQDLEILVWS